MRATVPALIAVVLALGVSACGGSGSSGPGDKAAGGTGGGCDNGNPYKIGVALPLSGATAEGGKQTSTGIDIAVADLNAKGGILGRCAKAVYKDTQADATTAVQVTRDLLDREQAGYVVGVINSSIIPPVSSVTGPANKILVVGGTDSIDYGKYPYDFRTEVTVGQIGAKYVDYMKRTLKLQRFGVLASNDAYGKGVANGVKAAAEQDGLTITRTELFNPASLDLTSQIRQLHDSGAQALVTVVYGQATIVALKARAAVGWTDAPIFGSNGFATKDVIGAVNSAALKNLLVSPTYKRLNRDGSGDISSPAAVAFRDKLKKKLGLTKLNDLMQQYAAGYDMVMVVARAIKAVGSDDSAKVRQYMEQHPYDGVRADYTFSPSSHDGVPDDAIGMAVGSSLNDGTLEAASGEAK